MATPTAPREERLDVVLPHLMAEQAERLRQEALIEQRHQCEAPRLEDAFAHLAIDHPDAITYDPNWRPGGTS